LPDLYTTSIVYRPEVGTENWRSAKEVYKKGYGDCEDLACYRVAELQEKGVKAELALKKTGKKRWHAIVQLPDGTIEDPSKRLRAKEKGKPMSAVKWKVGCVRGLGGNGGYLGQIEIPTGNRTTLKTTAIGQTPLQALLAAVMKGQQALQMPTVPKVPTVPQLPWQSMSTAFGSQPFAAMIPFLQAFGLKQQQQTTSAANSLASAIPDSIPGAPPEAQAGLKALKIGIKLAQNPKVKKAAKKLWRKGKKFGKKLKKLFKLW